MPSYAASIGMYSAHLAMALQCSEHINQLGSMRGGNATSDFQDGSQLSVRYVPHMQLQEARAEGAGKGPPARICACWVLCGKQLEVGVRLNSLL